jgi:hypothetical protein
MLRHASHLGLQLGSQVFRRFLLWIWPDVVDRLEFVWFVYNFEFWFILLELLQFVFIDLDRGIRRPFEYSFVDVAWHF